MFHVNLQGCICRYFIGRAEMHHFRHCSKVPPHLERPRKQIIYTLEAQRVSTSFNSQESLSKKNTPPPSTNRSYELTKHSKALVSESWSFLRPFDFKIWVSHGFFLRQGNHLVGSPLVQVSHPETNRWKPINPPSGYKMGP